MATYQVESTNKATVHSFNEFSRLYQVETHIFLFFFLKILHFHLLPSLWPRLYIFFFFKTSFILNLSTHRGLFQICARKHSILCERQIFVNLCHSSPPHNVLPLLINLHWFSILSMCFTPLPYEGGPLSLATTSPILFTPMLLLIGLYHASSTILHFQLNMLYGEMFLISMKPRLLLWVNFPRCVAFNKASMSTSSLHLR